jgi:ankyrin repeat protein
MSKEIEREPNAYNAFLLQDYSRVIEMLRAEPAQSSAVFGHENLTLLHCAAQDENVEIARLLISQGAKLDAQLIDGKAPLHLAASGGSCEMIDVLAQNGANLNLQDKYGNTPLILASASGAAFKRAIAERLLQYGATLDLASAVRLERVMSVRQLLDSHQHSDNIHYLLWVAVVLGNTSLVELLLAHGADPNYSTTSGHSPLTQACDNPSVRKELVKALLDNGGNPYLLRTEHSLSAIDFAARMGRKDIANLLSSRCDK